MTQMCNGKRGTKIMDECLLELIDFINSSYDGKFKTLLSCCGHGKYPSTIVVKNTRSQVIFDWFSGKILENYYKKGKIRNRFYQKDTEGYYFVPAVS